EMGVPSSTAEPGTMPTNLVNLTPCEPTTSLASRMICDAWKSGLERTWNGKSVGRRVSFGPLTWKVSSPPRVPGLTVFFRRLSAPAEKWQLAQACTPSLPACISQNSALPSLMAAGLFLTNWNRLGGSGTAIWLSGVLKSAGGGAIAGPGAPQAAPPGSSEPLAVSSMQIKAVVDAAIP